MAKYYGKIGYAMTVENPRDSGIWESTIVERNHYGDVMRNTSLKYNSKSNSTNDDISVNNTISILADPFALRQFQFMKYIEWMGTLWKITDVEIEFPRIKINIGGVYNGDTPRTQQST